MTPLFDNTLPEIKNSNANISNMSNEESVKGMPMGEEIGESERHFNGLEAECRKLLLYGC